jgi:AbrB family looped-hinge helix DNA binding protein
MILTQVGRRGQITIPRTVRQRLKIKEGDRVAFVQSKDGVMLQPLTQTMLDLRGSVPVSGPQDFTAIRQQVLETQARKIAKAENED